MLNMVRPVMVRVSKPYVSKGLHMPKIPYVVPKIDNISIFSVQLPTGQAPRYATNCICLAGAAPADASEIMLMSAGPVRPVTDEVVQLLATHRLNC